MAQEERHFDKPLSPLEASVRFGGFTQVWQRFRDIPHMTRSTSLANLFGINIASVGEQDGLGLMGKYRNGRPSAVLYHPLAKFDEKDKRGLQYEGEATARNPRAKIDEEVELLEHGKAGGVYSTVGLRTERQTKQCLRIPEVSPANPKAQLPKPQHG